MMPRLVRGWPSPGGVQGQNHSRRKSKIAALYVMDASACSTSCARQLVQLPCPQLVSDSDTTQVVLPRRATVALATQSDIQSVLMAQSSFKEISAQLGFITLSGVGFNPLRIQACFTSTTLVDCAAVDGTC